jgi:hypothetical protein
MFHVWVCASTLIRQIPFQIREQIFLIWKIPFQIRGGSSYPFCPCMDCMGVWVRGDGASMKGSFRTFFGSASPCVCVKGEEGLTSQTFHFLILSQMWEILLPSLVIFEIRYTHTA